MKLVIVESPAKSKTIEKYLEDAYTVRASVGHVRDLPKSNKKAIDIEKGFVPHYEITPGKEKVIRELKALADKAEEVVLATDPDREGEAIAWHLAETLDLNPKKTKRIVFHEITKEAVQNAIAHPRGIDENLRKAQEARRVLDRLVGYDLSGLIWKKVRYGLSAGRVQSPALRILMEREREIRAFTPEHYWVITADVHTENKEKIALTCTEEPKTEEEAARIVQVGTRGSWNVRHVKETEMKRGPRPPFITSTLQQAASTRLGFSPSRTMRIAQKLYEAGHITYMRTDSTTLSSSAITMITRTIEKKFGNASVATRQYRTKAKTAQEAHEAIRPTHTEKEFAGSTEEQKKLYALIWQRAVASQMIDATMRKTKITASVTPHIGDNPIPEFAATGSRIIEEGWLRADPLARGEDVILPSTSEKDPLELIHIQSEAKQTQPPNRYTEAGLIKELEKRGIGRPSTYAQIMKTLIEREYVTKDGKTLIPTDTGDVVSTFLEKNFGTYISDSFTAEMENELDEIANGTRDYERTLSEFYTPFYKEIKKRESDEKLTTLGEVSSEIRCPKCGSTMVIKLGRGGKFMSCARFPKCDGMRTIEGEEIKPSEPIGVHPETGEPIYVMSGRFGPYVQMGALPEKGAKPRQRRAEQKTTPKRASIPKNKDPKTVTIEDAVKYLSLPRTLGTHPESGKEITANIGRFGPYIVHDGDFRSLKAPDDVYTIGFDRALEILKEEKKTRRRKKLE